MARRPDPRQASFMDVLDSAPAWSPVQAEPAQQPDLADIVMAEARKRLPADAWDPYVRLIEVRQEPDGIYAAIECTDGLQKHVVVRGEPGAYLVTGLTVEGHPPMMWRSGTKVWERLP